VKRTLRTVIAIAALLTTGGLSYAANCALSCGFFTGNVTAAVNTDIDCNGGGSCPVATCPNLSTLNAKGAVVITGNCGTPRSVDYCQAFVDSTGFRFCETCVRGNFGAGVNVLGNFSCPNAPPETYTYAITVNDVTGHTGAGCPGCSCTPISGCTNCQANAPGGTTGSCTVTVVP